MAKAASPIPASFHTLTTHLIVDDVANAIDFYKRAFGATELYRLTGPDGKSVVHGDIMIGDTHLMLGPEMEGHSNSRSAWSLGGSPIGLYLYVDDSDTAFKKALDAGGKEKHGLADMFWGDRSGTLIDPYGLQWTVATRKEDLSKEELEQRAKDFFAKQMAA